MQKILTLPLQTICNPNAVIPQYPLKLIGNFRKLAEKARHTMYVEKTENQHVEFAYYMIVYDYNKK